MKETDLAELNRQVEELHRRQREESQRELDELFARSAFKNGCARRSEPGTATDGHGTNRPRHRRRDFADFAEHEGLALLGR